MNEQTPSNLADALSRTTDVLSGRIPTTATVRAPRAEFLKVELVPMSVVSRMEELNSDSSIFQGMLWALTGGLLGVATSLVLKGAAFSAIDKPTWVVIAALTLGIIVFATLWLRSTKRANAERAKLYDEMSRP